MSLFARFLDVARLFSPGACLLRLIPFPNEKVRKKRLRMLAVRIFHFFPFPTSFFYYPKAVFGGGVAPNSVAPHPQGWGWGARQKCIFGGVAPDFAPATPQGVGVIQKKSVFWGDGWRRILSPPTYPRENRGWRGVARSGMEISCSRRGGGVVQTNCISGGTAFCHPYPPGGGVRSKKCIWRGGGAGFCRSLPPGGSSIKVYFEGWHRIFAPLPPPGSGGRLNKCIWGGEVRRFLSPPGGTGGGAEWRGVARSPVHFWSREARSGTEIWRGVARRPVHF